MKKTLAWFAILAIITILPAFASASTFSHNDKITRNYEMDEDEEYIFKKDDFSDKNIAQTVYFYVSDSYFWDDNGAYLKSVEYDDGAIDFEFVIPESAYAPAPKKGYYLSLITGISEWIGEQEYLSGKWNLLSFYINDNETVVYLTAENFELDDGWAFVDEDAIAKQLD